VTFAVGAPAQASDLVESAAVRRRFGEYTQEVHDDYSSGPQRKVG
jgi:hypothetical protein